MMTKRFCALLSIALLASSSALADTPFDGTWSAACEGDRADNKTVIGDDRIVTSGVVCDIKEIRRIGGEGQVWRLTNSCFEEGETWIEDVIFGLEVDIDGKVVHLVEVGMDEGYVVTYQTCN